MGTIESLENSLLKYIYLKTIYAQNARLFYSILLHNIFRLYPIIYEPKLDELCLNFNLVYGTTYGMFINYDTHKGAVGECLDNWPVEPQVISMSDGSNVGTKGDVGMGSMAFTDTRRSFYVLGGFQPNQTLPIALDVGCDDEEILFSNHYLGLKCKRVDEELHEALMDEFMRECKTRWPSALIELVGFKPNLTLKYLEKYKDDYCVLVEDIQAVFITLMATLYNGMRSQELPVKDIKIVIYGGGYRAAGIASFIIKFLKSEGLDGEVAHERIYLVDDAGLVTSNRGALYGHQRPFARKDHTKALTLKALIETVHPYALLCLGDGEMPPIDKGTVVALRKYCPSGCPIIATMSHPSPETELSFANAVKWTDGNLLFASTRILPRVRHKKLLYGSAHLNTFLVTPGIALGVAMSGCQKVTDKMMTTIARYVASCCNPKDVMVHKKLLLPMEMMQEMAKRLACFVWNVAKKEKIAAREPPKDATELRRMVEDAIYSLKY